MKTRIFENYQLILTIFFSGTIIGTCLGILGTTINNRRRMKELRQIVTDSTKIHSTAAIAAAAAWCVLSQKVQAWDHCKLHQDQA